LDIEGITWFPFLDFPELSADLILAYMSQVNKGVTSKLEIYEEKVVTEIYLGK
jgi:hypothetical protein